VRYPSHDLIAADEDVLAPGRACQAFEVGENALPLIGQCCEFGQSDMNTVEIFPSDPACMASPVAAVDHRFVNDPARMSDALDHIASADGTEGTM
jgi:hypothetical protein